MSLSQAIEGDRAAYYAALEQGQCSNEIKPWITYFIEMLIADQDLAEKRVFVPIGAGRSTRYRIKL